MAGCCRSVTKEAKRFVDTGICIKRSSLIWVAMTYCGIPLNDRDVARGALRQFRIAGLEPVEMELHGLSRFPRRNSSPSGRLRIGVCRQTAFAVSRRDQGATCNELSPQDEGETSQSAAALVETSGLPSPLRGLFLPKIPGPVRLLFDGAHRGLPFLLCQVDDFAEAHRLALIPSVKLGVDSAIDGLAK